ncbi:NAD(P)H-binding protein [Streptomyces crystallinus]|uniref:NAD(P)H-binding protein n=1 Tax=Streptomyces crystallinus TaxID=68191 RepID=A0ABN1FEK2_9ACTN
MTTLVIGARGSVGRQVLDQLLALGEPVRASARDPRKADLPAEVPVVAADLTRPRTLPAALDGVRKVFVYATATGMADFAAAARAAGVEHVVVLSSGSVLLPYARGNAIAEEHRATEAALAASGLRWTPIRPLVLAGNALAWSSSIRAEGVVRLLHPEAATAPIHERDVAAAAVAALTGRPDAAVSDLLTGGELVSQRRQVELIGAAAGRRIRIEELTEAQARREFERFGSPRVAASVVQFIVAAARGGSPATGTARRVLGRPPLPFARWAADHAATFT